MRNHSIKYLKIHSRLNFRISNVKFIFNLCYSDSNAGNFVYINKKLLGGMN